MEENAHVDNRCHEYFENAAQEGIAAGACFCSAATDRDEMLEEIELLLDTIKGHTVTWPVVLDVEVPHPDWRTKDLPNMLRTELALLFQSKVSAAGYIPMLYCNSIPGMQSLLELPKLEGMRKWIAEYRFKPYYPYDFDIWQYSCTASVPGIEGNADLDLSFTDYGSCIT